MDEIAICFFGITRSLRHTMPSIEANVLTPARAQGRIRIYAHFFRQRHVRNLRSGENGAADPEEHHLLGCDWLRLEEPDACLSTWSFDTLKRSGDAWHDDFASLRNVVHQQHSLRQVTLAALADGAKVCLFCRPDLRYHDSLARPITRAIRSPNPLVQLPRWQAWEGGLNDRFALCSGEEAIRAYGTRIEQAANYCALRGPLHAERLLAYALREADIPVRRISTRAGRVRVDGHERHEDFLPPSLSFMRSTLRNAAIGVLRSLGLRKRA